MTFDVNNAVVALCIAGIQVEGNRSEALALYEQAWAARTDDFDASIAAHYLARLQETPELTLHWNKVALDHAEALADARISELLPSLCLNLAESYRVVGRIHDARQLARRGPDVVDALPAGGYADTVRAGMDRLHQRLDAS